MGPQHHCPCLTIASCKLHVSSPLGLHLHDLVVFGQRLDCPSPPLMHVYREDSCRRQSRGSLVQVPSTRCPHMLGPFRRQPQIRVNGTRRCVCRKRSWCIAGLVGRRPPVPAPWRVTKFLRELHSTHHAANRHSTPLSLRSTPTGGRDFPAMGRQATASPHERARGR